LHENREMEFSTEPETGFSESYVEPTFDPSFNPPSFQLQNYSASNLNSKKPSFKHKNNEYQKIVNEKKAGFDEKINSTLKKPISSDLELYNTKFELENSTLSQFKLVEQNNEFLKSLFSKKDDLFLHDEIFEFIQDSFQVTEQVQSKVVFTTELFWLFRLFENSQSSKLKSVFMIFQNLKVNSNKNKELSTFLQRFFSKKTKRDFLFKSFLQISNFAESKRTNFALKAQKCASFKSLLSIFRFKNLSNFLFTFSKMRFSFQKTSPKIANSNFDNSLKLAFVSFQTIINSKIELHKKHVLNLLVTIYHKRQLSLSAMAARKTNPSMANIAKQLHSIDQKIGILKSDFQKNEENVQEIRKITEKTSKNNMTKIERQITTFLNKNKSNEKLSSPFPKNSTPKVKRKTLTEAFQEQNSNLAKFLENHRLASDPPQNNANLSQKKLVSSVAKHNPLNSLDSGKKIARIHVDILPKREFIGIRDIYFS